MSEIPPSSSIAQTDLTYRCMQCGIESKEATCFIGVAAKGPQRYSLEAQVADDHSVFECVGDF